ncbi:MAG: putative F420-dependent oxidoreductase, Rv2161c family [Actinomycetia bacterium]|nr:putative F420-dependent oxidoreductase, Rv2161c family [Actinomycetes bacterium]
MHPTVSVVPEGKLVCGLQLPVQALSVRTSQEWEREGAGVDELVRVAQACDAASFFYVAVCHHIAIPRSHAEMMSTQWFDPVPTLAYIAAKTERTRVMTNVYVAPFRHPLDTAKAFATLDALSGGRLILGVGTGHVEAEFEMLGVPFADRGALTNEAIDGIVAAWTDEYPVLAGPHWPVKEMGQRPRPAQQPRPPIWVGGYGKPALRRVAERGDGWIPQGTPRKKLPEDIGYILEHRERARPGENLEIGYITEYVHLGEPTWETPKGTLSGSPERIVESFNELGEMGVAHLQLRFATRSADELCDQIAAFGENVVPHLTRRPLN